MATQWPLVLQQCIDESGFSFSIGETTITSEVDVGILKKRRVFTKSIDNYSGSITLPKSDFNTFYDFFNVSLAGGALPFTFPNPFNGNTDTFRFKSSPKIAPLGGEYFKVSMDWERLP